MFGFDKIDFQRMTVAALGALILTTTFVSAAVAPASVPLSECGVAASQVSDHARV
jgi:hypothetical protein